MPRSGRQGAGGAEPRLCLGCHPGLAEELRNATLHAPLSGERACLECHTPHASPVPGLLPRSQAAVCGRCHSEQADRMKSSSQRHPDPEGRQCTMCHNPHLATAAGMVPAGPDPCLRCHTWLEHTDHPLGAGTTDPVRGGEIVCASCHDPHGSSSRRCSGRMRAGSCASVATPRRSARNADRCELTVTIWYVF
ncbi:MAG: hypothetical protein IPM94_14050 [bacterium]|nr:hypothetical protein [bacterium]